MPRNRTLTTLLATLAVLAGALVAAPAHAADPIRIRILLAGDSITQGFHGDYTWRYRLAKEFERQGVPVDFVGSRREVFQATGWAHSDYADPNFDRDHFAWAGIKLGELAGRITDEVSAQQPDLLVLAAGVNDLRGGATPQATNDNLRRAITKARDGKSNIRIVVSPVLDALEASQPSLGSKIIQYNDRARATVTDMNTSQSPVTMAKTTNTWQRTQHTIEDLHPNPTGETHIAQRIGEALVGLKVQDPERVVLTSQPKIFRVLPWTRTAPVKAVRSGTRVQLSWSWQRTWSARVMTKRVGASAATYNWVPPGSMTTAPLVGGATYEFRIQLIYGRMTGPYGPITRITMPRGPAPAPVARVVVDRRGAHWTRSALATSYLVKFRKGKKKRWVTRTTTGLQMLAPKMKRARVWAVNPSGRSAMRVGVR